MANDDRFNPASATREMFTQAINRALNDMTDAEIRAYVQSAVGTEMSQRQMADLNLQTTIESAISSIRSEMTHKASTSDVTAAVGEEAAARQAADLELYGLVSDLDDTKATVGDIYGLPQKTIAPAEGTTDTLASYTQPGTYVIPTAAAAGRITDAPISDKGYRMEVKQYRSGAYYRQTIMPWGEPNAFYTRSRQGGTNWTAWYKFEGTQAAVSSQSSAASLMQASLMQAGRLDAELTNTQEVTDDA